MKRAVVLLMALAACGEDAKPPLEGPAINVLFDERHGLEGGETVRMHEFDIGVVEEVDLAQGRVRARLIIEPDVLGQLTEASTFSVEDDGERYLEAHVIDPDATPLTEGATVEGVDSGWELTARQASSSAWWKKASDFVDEVKREIDEIDWSEEEKEARKSLDEAMREMEELASEGYGEAAERIEELAKELEELGRSEEAQKLRERFRELLEELK